VSLPPAPELDVLDWIAQADAAIQQARRQLAAAVIRARQNGRSWAEIAGRLGTTRQAAQQRFGNDP
jgi:predicted transcriptional regulator